MRVYLGNKNQDAIYHERSENYYRYLSESEIKNCKPLSKEELKELFYKWKNGGDEDAFWKIIKSNLRYVMKYATRFSNGRGVNYDNLVAAGNVALIKALTEYDFEKNGGEFRSWANYYLEKAMARSKEYDVYQFNIPWKYKIRARQEKHNIETETYKRFSVSDVVQSFSMNEVYDDSGEEKTEFSKYIKSDSSTDGSFDYEIISMGMKDLSEKERFVIEYHFGINGKGSYTCKEIADMMGIKSHNVMSIQKKAIAKLKTNITKIIQYEDESSEIEDLFN